MNNACFLKTLYHFDNNQFDIKPIDLFLQDIKSEKYKALIARLPDPITQEEEYKAAKKALPAWACNGTFEGSITNKTFTESNGLFHFDVDKLSKTELDKAFKDLSGCDAVYAVWRSPSGHGLKGLIRVPDDYIHNDADFKKAYQQIEPYLFSQFEIKLDTACKDVRRLCFVSCDPDIYINENAIPYPLEKVIEKPKAAKSSKSAKSDNQAITRACNIITQASEGGYHTARCKAGYLAGGQIAASLVNENDAIRALLAVSDAVSSQYGDSEATIKTAHKAIMDGIENGKSAPVSNQYKTEKGETKTPPPDNDEDIDTVNLSHEYPTFKDSNFYGIAGEVAALAVEHSEADKVAVYFSFLTAAASMLGRDKFLQVGDSRHYARLFTAIVGASSRARKGTSFKPVERIIKKAEEMYQQTANDFVKESLIIANGGLSSAEGLIYAVRDESEETTKKDNAPVWLGVDDKRLLIVEEELGSVFKVAQREGNQLSPVLRKAWDGGTLAPMTKNNRMRSTDPHINTIGHITQFELKELVSNSDIYNGLINRFLWACVRRTKKLSTPQPMDDSKVLELAIKLSSVFKKSKSTENNEIQLNTEARNLWDIQYHIVSTDREGVMGAVTARNEAHVLRLALLFCLLDGMADINTAHLKAAIAVVDYATASCEFIFTVPSEESPDAQKLLSALDIKPLSQTEISQLFNGNKNKAQLTQLLTELQTINKISKRTIPNSKKVMWEKIKQ